MDEKVTTTELSNKEMKPETAMSDHTPWYAIKLFTVRQKAVAAYFNEKGLETFIPEEYVDIEDENHKVKRVLCVLSCLILSF